MKRIWDVKQKASDWYQGGSGSGGGSGGVPSTTRTGGNTENSSSTSNTNTSTSSTAGSSLSSNLSGILPSLPTTSASATAVWEYATHSVQDVADSAYSTVSGMVSSMNYYETPNDDDDDNSYRTPRKQKEESFLQSLSSTRTQRQSTSTSASSSSSSAAVVAAATSTFTSPLLMFHNPYNSIRGRNTDESSMQAVRSLIALNQYNNSNNNNDYYYSYLDDLPEQHQNEDDDKHYNNHNNKYDDNNEYLVADPVWTTTTTTTTEQSYDDDSPMKQQQKQQQQQQQQHSSYYTTEEYTETELDNTAHSTSYPPYNTNNNNRRRSSTITTSRRNTHPAGFYNNFSSTLSPSETASQIAEGTIRALRDMALDEAVDLQDALRFWTERWERPVLSWMEAGPMVWTSPNGYNHREVGRKVAQIQAVLARRCASIGELQQQLLSAGWAKGVAQWGVLGQGAQWAAVAGFDGSMMEQPSAYNSNSNNKNKNNHRKATQSSGGGSSSHPPTPMLEKKIKTLAEEKEGEEEEEEDEEEKEKNTTIEESQVLSEKSQVLSEKSQVISKKSQVLSEKSQVISEEDQLPPNTNTSSNLARVQSDQTQQSEDWAFHVHTESQKELQQSDNSTTQQPPSKTNYKAPSRQQQPLTSSARPMPLPSSFEKQNRRLSSTIEDIDDTMLPPNPPLTSFVGFKTAKQKRKQTESETAANRRQARIFVRKRHGGGLYVDDPGFLAEWSVQAIALVRRQLFRAGNGLVPIPCHENWKEPPSSLSEGQLIVEATTSSPYDMELAKLPVWASRVVSENESTSRIPQNESNESLGDTTSESFMMGTTSDDNKINNTVSSRGVEQVTITNVSLMVNEVEELLNIMEDVMVLQRHRRLDKLRAPTWLRCNWYIVATVVPTMLLITPRLKVNGKALLRHFVEGVRQFYREHVRDPMVAIANELLKGQESFSDKKARMEAMKSLKKMIASWLEDTYPDMPEGERNSMAEAMDITLIEQKKEESMKTFYEINNVIRMSFIEMQYMKKEMMNALHAMDEMKSANDINMNLAAVTPAILVAYGVSRVFKFVLYAFLKLGKSREETYASFRHVLTDIERLLVMRDNPPQVSSSIADREEQYVVESNKPCVLGSDDLGMLMLLIHECRSIMSKDRRRFSGAIVRSVSEDLAELAGERGAVSVQQQLRIVERMCRSYPFLKVISTGHLFQYNRLLNSED